MRILVVEDEQNIALLIEHYLKEEGFEVLLFHEAQGVLAALRTTPVDLAVLDIMLPDQDGVSLLRDIRKEHAFPVLFVTAKITETDQINGLYAGADDYIKKPFRPLELMARIQAQLRRTMTYNPAIKREEVERLLVHQELTLDPSSHRFFIGKELVNLTPKEFDLLALFLKEPHRVFGPEEIFSKVWQDTYLESSNNTIMVHIRHLREKISEHTNRRYIKTVWGVGYQLE
ncbi:Two-component response regulator SA14-24 [Clostridiaceae bacterium JG1575]|nr:Two-component response regulator SA14-24 [Clostridiaceae bacterium JG1575]